MSTRPIGLIGEPFSFPVEPGQPQPPKWPTALYLLVLVAVAGLTKVICS